MLEINLSNVSKSFGFKKVLDGLDLEIKTGDRIALIGENGCGKSTILKIINGIESPDSGNVTVRKGITIGYLSQQPEIDNKDKTVHDMLYEGAKDILELANIIKKYEIKMKSNPNDYELINKYSNVLEKFMNIGGYEIDTKIKKVVYGLNIENLVHKKYDELSGGEQKKVALAILMIKKIHVLVLDEPTNHLDIDTLEWLENYLNKYNGTILVVSHDRYFLDHITNKTVLIENGKAIPFYGNYSYYLKENELRLDREFKEYKDQQKMVSAMKRKIKQLEEFGKRAYPGGESFFKRAENIRKRLARLELKNKPVIKKELPINLKFDDRSGKSVLKISNYDLYMYNKLLIKNINLTINYGEKICLIGGNGCGKTTLIEQIINGNEEKIVLGSNVKIGYISQQISFTENLTILEYAHKYYNGDESHLRSALNKFYFHGENVFKQINKLSSGEKVRLKLFELINNNSNFIILDEPTNHIDIYTKESLESALKEFKGTILFISHDRYFINQLADKVYYISNGNITEYIGNYDYFIEHKNTNN